MSSHKLFKKINLCSPSQDSAIVEIGSVRDILQYESGDNSTVFFNDLSKSLEIEFFSVDFSQESVAFARKIVGSKAIQSDGTSFLKNFNQEIFILYLDNFDIVYSDKHKESLMARVGQAYIRNNEVISNERSANVHLEQIKTALPLMSATCYVCVDDTIKKPEGWWGKGALVVPYLIELDFEIIELSDVGVLLKRTAK